MEVSPSSAFLAYLRIPAYAIHFDGFSGENPDNLDGIGHVAPAMFADTRILLVETFC